MSISIKGKKSKAEKLKAHPLSFGLRGRGVGAWSGLSEWTIPGGVNPLPLPGIVVVGVLVRVSIQGFRPVVWGREGMACGVRCIYALPELGGRTLSRW